jgi:hypothetical protein
MSQINRFLLENNLGISTNPCVSPDFCLDWPALSAKAGSRTVKAYPKSRFVTAAGAWTLIEDEATGDCAWRLEAQDASLAVHALADGVSLNVRPGAFAFPATWENLIRLKNAVQEHDPGSTIFPTAGANLGRSTLGIGARFTTLHWPAVDWAMSALDLGVTANQNSIPRELVYDVDAMREGRLDSVPFPFIGTSVPEGHQGQSVEGMSHGCVLSKLKTGFHRRGIAWSFNADHQPIGGKFDAREDALVRGCVLASYITFDLSPELAQTQVPPDAGGWVATHVPPDLFDRIRTRVAAAGLRVEDSELSKLLAYVWPAMDKMKRRDAKYRAAREQRFTTDVGRSYLRELSIDELPGQTTPETTAVMLSLCEALDMRVNFVAPAFGFQKNAPYPDNSGLRSLIEKQWAVCRSFGVSIGFHSGSGKSAENYRVMGEVTGGCLEIKTSGRYTYEMGVALAASKNASDAALWRDWYGFTLDMALAGAFSSDSTEQKMARVFIATALGHGPSERMGPTHAEGMGPTHVGPVLSDRPDAFTSPETCRAALEALPPSPDHMFFFEYNFLYVLAAGGRADKAALGDHSPAGYTQRARFYAISPEARLNYSKAVAKYIIFLAETTGLAPAARCAAAAGRLDKYTSLEAMVDDIG